MKNYIKPEVTYASLENKNMLCSLAKWLEQGENIYADAGITTYQIES